jgi:RNA polymerase sigma factor (sigma-70 family)
VTSISSDAVDESVIERAQGGDAEAFAAIYRTYRGPVFGYLCRLVGDYETAADVAQDVFVKAYQAIGRTRPNLNLKPWLFAIATNQAVSHHRRRRLIEWMPLEQSWPEPCAPAEEERIATREALAAAMSTVPTDHLACLILRVQSGFSYEEIGSMLHIPAATARTRAFRTRLALHQALRVDEEGA